MFGTTWAKRSIQRGIITCLGSRKSSRAPTIMGADRAIGMRMACLNKFDVADSARSANRLLIGSWHNSGSATPKAAITAIVRRYVLPLLIDINCFSFGDGFGFPALTRRDCTYRILKGRCELQLRDTQYFNLLYGRTSLFISYIYKIYGCILA